MNKIIVYTVNTNGYDKKHKNLIEDDAQFLYYTDKEAPEGWEKVDIGDKHNRFYKINSHFLPPHDYSIYIDACFKIKKPLSELIKLLGDNDIAICKHPRDNCVYQHARRCKILKLDDESVINRVVTRHRDRKLPTNIGLTENCLIIRKNTEQIKNLNEKWWKEYRTGSKRDQLSLPYALWKTRTKVTYLPFSARDNEFIRGWGQHKLKKR